MKRVDLRNGNYMKIMKRVEQWNYDIVCKLYTWNEWAFETEKLPGNWMRRVDLWNWEFVWKLYETFEMMKLRSCMETEARGVMKLRKCMEH